LTSVALHALLLAPLVLGAGLHAQSVPDRPGTEAADASDDSAMSVVLIEDSAVAARQAIETPNPAALVITPPWLTHAELREALQASAIPDLEPASDPQSAPQSATSSAPADDASLLYGRYVGQISARIERAWLRPRRSPGGELSPAA
jgi:hypothetical protein